MIGNKHVRFAGTITDEARRRQEEIRSKLQSVDARARPGFDQAKDYYTSEEVAKFMKPKKKVISHPSMAADAYRAGSSCVHVKPVCENCCSATCTCHKYMRYMSMLECSLHAVLYLRAFQTLLILVLCPCFCSSRKRCACGKLVMKRGQGWIWQP